MKAVIHVRLRSGILDPQGRAIYQSLQALGFSGVEDVRVGKCFEIMLHADNLHAAEAQVQAMCDKLLANPVIEEYRYELGMP
ncbi:MAG: phosphoribosylformylglycinamidine synthase subunit PurS [Nitrospirae bacterium]|nr:MAG: phosphoribosylformylglycinamidine synthase subunit PurS [Nitrospirota bacterium]